MRKLALIGALLLLAGCQEYVVMDVPAIHCEGCAAKVTEVLGEQPGVERVTVDVATKQATVTIDKTKFDGAAAVAVLDDYQFPDSKIVDGNIE